MISGNNLPIVHFLIGEVSLDGAERDAYVEAKLRSYVRLDHRFPAEGLKIAQSAAGTRLPLAEESALPEFGEGVKEEIERMKACLMRILYQQSPLLDGEEYVSDRVTYLIAQTGFFPAGTVTVELTTNRAILYYVISSARLNGRGGLLIAPGTGTNLQTEVIQTLAASDTFQDTATATGAKIVEDLTKQYLVEAGTSIAAQAVLGSISGGLATLVLGGLFDVLFPPSPPAPNFFDYLPALEQLIRQEIEADTRDKINGAFQEIVQLIHTQYTPVRNDPAPLSDPIKYTALAEQLDDFVNILTVTGSEGVMGTLQTPRYAQPGFPAFLFGATLHLGLLQERANITYYRSKQLYDDAVRPGSGSIALQAQIYHDVAIGGAGTWVSLKNTRKDDIKTYHVQSCHTVGRGTVCTSFIEVRDQDAAITDFQVNKDGTAQSLADQYIQFYYWPLQLDALARSLNFPVSLASGWLSLVNSPMGTTVGDWPPAADTPSLGQTLYIMVGASSPFLAPGDLLFSEDEMHRLVYGDDGNLVLYDWLGKIVWTSNTPGAAFRACMHGDGNFVVYSADNVAVFATGTQGNPDAYAVVTDDGHFQIRSTRTPQTVYWST